MSTTSYSFRHHLKADLVRFHQVFGGRVPDGIRFFAAMFSARFFPVLLYRVAYDLAHRRLGPIAKLVSIVNFTFFGIEIGLRCPIGPGLILPHTQGTVIGSTSIGANATIFQGVTLGARELDADFDFSKRPVVGDNVVIGSGAKVLGGISIGDNVRIGANTVVLDSLPDGALAVGAATRLILAAEPG